MATTQWIDKSGTTTDIHDFAISGTVYFSYKGESLDNMKESLTTTKIYSFRDAVHQLS